VSSSVSVIIPVRNAASTLSACLDGVATQVGVEDVEVEVVVVDNGSTDGSGDLARAHPVVTRVVVESRPGSYAARNAGLAAASGQLLAFTDADTVPQAGWLAAARARMDDGADAVGGAIEPVRSAAPTVWERYDTALYLDQRSFVERDGFAATANLVVRRDVLDAVGAFDATLRSSGDLEFGRRLTAAGYRLVYAPDALVLHTPRRTARDTWKLHRRLGAGWRALGRRGADGPADPTLPLGAVVDAVAADGPPLRRRQLVGVHALATVARAVGRATGRS
jgi:glycosyltransferase involved in cell wall biosynthesis